MPLVSVIIPTYNSSWFLAETVKSVQMQSYQEFEILIIDDCSKDDTLTVARRLADNDPRIRILRNEMNCGGPARGRNRGLDEALGEYVAFIDSDDIWHPQKLELQLNFMREAGVDFTATEKLEFRGPSQELHPLLDATLGQYVEGGFHENLLQRVSHRSLLKKNIIPNSSVVIKRSLFQGLRYNESSTYTAVEDFHMWLLLHQRLHYSVKIKLPLLFYRVLSTSISRSKFSMFVKVNNLLREYNFNGQKLGIKRYYYLTHYMVRSLSERMIPKGGA